MSENQRVLILLIGCMLAAALIAYFAAERPFRFSLVDRECEAAQQQYYDARSAQKLHSNDAHNHADVCAQHRMANAAERGLWALYFTLAFSGFAAVMAWRTVRTMQDTARRELRAYVFGTPGTIVFSGRTPSRLNFSVRNSGQTPAYNLVAQVALLLRPYPPTSGFDPGVPDVTMTTNVLGAGDTRPFKRPLGRPMSAEVEAQLRAGTHRYYAVGVIRYYDVFRETIRTSRFCASVPGAEMIEGISSPPNSEVDIEWEFTDRHNDAD